MKKEINKCCMLCANASKTNTETFICRIMGPVDCEHKCKRFQYDPFKRIPQEPIFVKSASEDNFDL